MVRHGWTGGTQGAGAQSFEALTAGDPARVRPFALVARLGAGGAARRVSGVRTAGVVPFAFDNVGPGPGTGVPVAAHVPAHPPGRALVFAVLASCVRRHTGAAVRVCWTTDRAGATTPAAALSSG
ncbi:hypothetical protein [Streptomyces sp. SBT349]|uniref:hypothetical protein n=1 Tax=Streptomyces sp. SBT349 TaxID=1580539 RepID=UPI00066B54C4|nr:hypothetical protein [Streptomyces sp. SBT349]